MPLYHRVLLAAVLFAQTNLSFPMLATCKNSLNLIQLFHNMLHMFIRPTILLGILGEAKKNPK